MNLFNELVMEVEQEGKKFRTHFPPNVSYQQCFDFLQQCANQIIKMSQEWEASQKANETQPDQPAEQPAQSTPEGQG